MARRLAHEEGILAGGSAGSTVWGAIQVAERLPADATVLAIIPDSGRSYMSKFYDDNWMLEHGFVERLASLPTVDELLRAKHGGEVPELVTIAAHAKVGEGIDTMQRYGISQLPVVRDGQCESLADVIGSLQDRALLERVFGNPDAVHEDVAAAMQPPLAAVEASATLDEVFATLTGGSERGRRRAGGEAGRRPHPLRPARVPGPQALTAGYAPGMPVDRLESLLRDAFPDAAELRVEDRTGGGDHFQVTVESPRFDGLPLLEQHRLVNDALAEPLRDGTIHELRIKTRGTT